MDSSKRKEATTHSSLTLKKFNRKQPKKSSSATVWENYADAKEYVRLWNARAKHNKTTAAKKKETAIKRAQSIKI